MHAHGGGRFAIKGRVDVIAVTAQLHRGHFAEQHHGTGAVGLDHHIAKFFGGLQLAARGDGGIELLAGHGGQGAQLPGRHFGVLRLQGGGHVRRHKGIFLQQRRVQPDAHGVARAHGFDFTDAVDAADGVEQGAGDVIANLRAGHARVIRGQRGNHQEIRAALGHGQAFALHRAGQARFHLLELVLHLHLRHVGIRAGLKGEVDTGAARRTAGGRHIGQLVDTGHLLLDHLCHRVLDRFGRCAGVGGGDFHGGRCNVRVLFKGQLGDRQRAREHDHNGDHPGKNRPINKEARHVQPSRAIAVGAARVGSERVSLFCASTSLPTRTFCPPSTIT